MSFFDQFYDDRPAVTPEEPPSYGGTPVAPPVVAAPSTPTAPTSPAVSGDPVEAFVDKMIAKLPWRAPERDYFIGRIRAEGGLTGQYGPDYWERRMTDPPGVGSNAPTSGTLSSLGPSGPPPTFTPYQAPAPFNFGDFSYDAFTAPDPEEAKKDPAYQFRLDEGEKALQASASARGTLRTGGTLKDISNYASDYASSEYDKIYGRKFNEFQTGYQNALGQYNANRANQYGNYALNAQTGQWEWQSNNAGSLASWAAQYGMGQDEIHNLLTQSQIGATAAGNTPSPVPTTTTTPTTGVIPPSAPWSTTPVTPPPVTPAAAPMYQTPTRLTDLYAPSRRAYA